MSKGSRTVTFRIDEETYQMLKEELDKRLESMCVVPEDTTTFIRKAIRELVFKRRRGRASRSQPLPRDADGWPQLQYTLASTSSEVR